jgi:hypothetical protein
MKNQFSRSALYSNSNKMDMSITEHFPFLKGMKSQEFEFHLKTHASFAAAIVDACLPYLPGVYLVYDYTNNKLGDLLYLGKAGMDRDGTINTHQLPRRLLATINPTAKYRKHKDMPQSKDVTRNVAWPIMMKVDKIESLKIFCFYSKLTDSRVHENDNPLIIEKRIRQLLHETPKWARR